MNALAQNPQAMMGVLIALECGLTIERVAAGLGHRVGSLIDAVEAARAGNLPRQMPWSGDRMVSEAIKASPQPALREEVLVKRWMRRVARHMHQHGEISVNQVRALVDTESETASVWMSQLQHQFKGLGITYRSEMRGECGLVYVLDGESRERLAAIIAADWRMAVTS